MTPALAAQVVTGILLISGATILLIAAAGVLRFPDFYTRLHAAGKGDTMGQLLILVGLMIPAGLSLVSLKLAMIAFFIFVCNPTATHALARVAWRSGLPPALGDDPHAPDYSRVKPLTPAEKLDLLVPVDEHATLTPSEEEGR